MPTLEEVNKCLQAATDINLYYSKTLNKNFLNYSTLSENASKQFGNVTIIDLIDRIRFILKKLA